MIDVLAQYATTIIESILPRVTLFPNTSSPWRDDRKIVQYAETAETAGRRVNRS